MVLKWIKRATISRRNKDNNKPQNQSYDPKILEIFHKAEEALSHVEVPGYDLDLISAGIVKKLRLASGKLIVFLDYYGTDPSCFFCRFINQALWNTILSKAANELSKNGINNVEFIDYYTGLRLEYNKKW